MNEVTGLRDEIAGCPSGRFFEYETAFDRQLGQWADTLGAWTPWTRPWVIEVSGSYRAGESVTRHGGGRAIDISRIRAGETDLLDARFDVWKDHPHSSTRVAFRRRYWTVSASLHYHFRNVLTYFFSSEHLNHIHVDNEVYGCPRDSAFDPASRAQVVHVQACCNYIWNRGTPITGVWDSRTQADSAWVSRKVGRATGSPADSPRSWLAFNEASTQQGSGVADWLWTGVRGVHTAGRAPEVGRGRQQRDEPDQASGWKGQLPDRAGP